MTIEVKKYNQNGEELAIRFGLGGIKAVGIAMIEEMIKNRQQNDSNFKDIYDFASNSGTKAVNKKALDALAKSGSFDSIHSNRNQIVESVEILCKYASAKEEEKNSNQMSLFGAAQMNEENPTLKVVEDWGKEQKLQEEFKAFGFFLNEHPIDDFLDALGHRGIISSEDLEEIDDNNIIKLAGVVAYSKHKSGPKGRYAYLTLSDPFGIYETAIFDEALITTYRDVMGDGNSLVVECLVRKDQGGFRLLVKTIERLEDFIKNTHPKKDVYKDIKQQKKRGEFDWKKRNQEKADTKNDSVVRELEYKRKIDELKSRQIIKRVSILVNDRQSILKLKGFLSQRLAPDDFDQFSEVYFLIENQDMDPIKINLNNKYLITKEDVEKIEIIAKVKTT